MKWRKSDAQKVSRLGPAVFLPAVTTTRAPEGRQAVRMRAVDTWLVNSEARGEAQ
jgi:sarcosine oxidase gamma subunit